MSKSRSEFQFTIDDVKEFMKMRKIGQKVNFKIFLNLIILVN